MNWVPAFGRALRRRGVQMEPNGFENSTNQSEGRGNFINPLQKNSGSIRNCSWFIVGLKPTYSPSVWADLRNENTRHMSIQKNSPNVSFWGNWYFNAVKILLSNGQAYVNVFQRPSSPGQGKASLPTPFLRIGPSASSPMERNGKWLSLWKHAVSFIRFIPSQTRRKEKYPFIARKYFDFFEQRVKSEWEKSGTAVREIYMFWRFWSSFFSRESIKQFCIFFSAIFFSLLAVALCHTAFPPEGIPPLVIQDFAWGFPCEISSQIKQIRPLLLKVVTEKTAFLFKGDSIFIC